MHRRDLGPESPRAILIQSGIILAAVAYLGWHVARAVAEGTWP